MDYISSFYLSRMNYKSVDCTIIDGGERARFAGWANNLSKPFFISRSLVIPSSFPAWYQMVDPPFGPGVRRTAGLIESPFVVTASVCEPPLAVAKASTFLSADLPLSMIDSVT